MSKKEEKKKGKGKKKEYNDDGWIEIESGMKTWEVGDEVMGTLAGFKNLRFGNRAIIIEDGKDQILVAETVSLTGKFKDSEIGNEIKIRYQGEEKSEGTGQMFKSFKIFKRPENVL